jgi:hypothetical protein
MTTSADIHFPNPEAATAATVFPRRCQAVVDGPVTEWAPALAGRRMR